MVPGTWVLEYRVLPRTAADSAATRARGRRGLPQNVQNDVQCKQAPRRRRRMPLGADAASRTRDNHVQVINIDVTLLKSTVTAEPHHVHMPCMPCAADDVQLQL